MRERVGQVIIALALNFFFANSISIEYYFEQVHHKIPMDNS